MDTRIANRYKANLRARAKAILDELIQQKHDLEHWNRTHLPHDRFELPGLDEQIEAMKRGDLKTCIEIGQRESEKARREHPEWFEDSS